MEEVKRCSRCILPETFPEITFNERGVCNFCLNHKNVPVKGEAKLKEILGTEKGKVYDCVVPISGGKDSTYILYYAVRMLELRVVAVNYDSGFQSDLAKENMRNACRKLGIPLLVVKADYENQVKMLREVLRVSEILGTFFSICGNCEANIRTVAINIARKYRVPFILYGGSASEDIGIGKLSFTGARGFLGEMVRIDTRYVFKVLFHIIKYCLYSVRQRIQMNVAIKYRFLPGQLFPSEPPFPSKGVRAIHFFDYVEYDLTNRVNLLRERLGWKSPSDRLHRFDCILHCFGNHHWLRDSGISMDGFNYSTLIREKRMSREDAFLVERGIEKILEGECFLTLKKIGLKDYEMPKIARALNNAEQA